MSIISDAINKYGGTDEVYKNKLKEEIRNTMGYSNYMSKLGKETSAPATAPPMKGNILPSGVLAGQQAGYSMQNQRINTLQGVTGAIDTAAGSIASSLAAKNKAKDKYRYDTSFVYQPTNPVDQRILEHAQNPYNEDGSTKSLQQLEAELNQEFGQAEGYSPEDIKNMIVEKLPSDYMGKERQYQYRFNGMSEEQATDEMIIDYGNMIVMGRGKDIPPEFFPAAYATLSPAEKVAVQKLKKSAADTLLEGM
jgi:hypothetical protein